MARYLHDVGRAELLGLKLLDYSPSFAVVGEVFFLETRFLSHGARGGGTVIYGPYRYVPL